jgi:chromate transporter
VSTPNPFVFFLLVLKATLFSTGGTGNLPSLHDDLAVARHWATEQQVAEAVSIGQVSPGPTGLWVVSLGCVLDGVRGGLLASLAVTLPPLLVLATERFYRRVRHHPAIEGFVRGLGLAVVGVGAVILWRLLAGTGGLRLSSLVVAAASAALMATRRVPVLVILVLAAMAAILLPR